MFLRRYCLGEIVFQSGQEAFNMSAAFHEQILNFLNTQMIYSGQIPLGPWYTG
jgi:hypothetical protein